MAFEWNEEKDRANQRQHGISFAFATAVFEDGDRTEREDTDSPDDEMRWCTTGLIDRIELYVLYTAGGEAIRRISARRASRNERENIGIVKFKFDPKNPPKMTAAQMKRLREMKDEEIDYSDAPASPRNAEWTRPGALICGENKKQITVRLDADVLEFFKKTGTRYQSRINAALREYMKAHEKAS